ncbi:MAG: LLM class flavin-dependent oxidoreductase, partial [Dehalococcoidia bacterium]
PRLPTADSRLPASEASMTTPVLTLNVSGSDAARTVAAIVRAERFGLAGVWVPTMGVGPDALTSLAAAAMRTERVSLGTGVLPAFPRHPLVMAQQALAVASLAPGRLRLGIGTSHRQGMEGVFGVDMRAPLRHLREYLRVLKTALADGTVEHVGPRYTVHARLPAPEPPVPVMIAALGPGAFRLAGEAADGAVSWLCPPAYLERVALPALREGAERSGRPAPPLVAGLPIAVCTDAEAVRATVRTQLAGYVRAPFYQQMLVAAGLPEATAGTWSDRMVEEVVLAGDEAAVADRLSALAAAGIDEVAVTPLLVGPDSRASMQRTLELLAALSLEPPSLHSTDKATV